jgi:hypothetical protein
MKLNRLIIGLLIGFLVACDRTQTDPIVQSTPQPQKVDATKQIPKSMENLEAAQPTGDQQSQNKKSDNVVGADNSPYAIGKAAKLTSDQVKELIEMEKRKGYKRFGSKEEVKAKFVLPTYLPPGFNVSHFRTKYNEKLGGKYEIVYCNSSKFCFLIEGGILGAMGDGPISYETIKDISSLALGKVELGYANYDRTNNKPHIGFTGSVNRFSKDNNDYIFQSPSMIYVGNHKAISMSEGIKIVQSLQYLNR